MGIECGISRRFVLRCNFEEIPFFVDFPVSGADSFEITNAFKSLACSLIHTWSSKAEVHTITLTIRLAAPTLLSTEDCIGIADLLWIPRAVQSECLDVAAPCGCEFEFKIEAQESWSKLPCLSVHNPGAGTSSSVVLWDTVEHNGRVVYVAVVPPAGERQVQFRVRMLYQLQPDADAVRTDWSSPSAPNRAACDRRAEFTIGALCLHIKEPVYQHISLDLNKERKCRAVIVRTAATVQDSTVSASSGCEVFLFRTHPGSHGGPSSVEAHYSRDGLEYQPKKLQSSILMQCSPRDHPSSIARWDLPQHGFLRLMLSAAATHTASSDVNYKICVLDRRAVSLPCDTERARASQILVELPARTGPGHGPWILNELSVYGCAHDGDHEQLLVPCSTVVSTLTRGRRGPPVCLSWVDPLSSANNGLLGLKTYPTGVYHSVHDSVLRIDSRVGCRYALA